MEVRSSDRYLFDEIYVLSVTDKTKKKLNFFVQYFTIFFYFVVKIRFDNSSRKLSELYTWGSKQK